MLSLEDCRRFYAEEIQYAANLTSPALIDAFARVPRERFLGPGPWHVAMQDLMSGGVRYMTTVDADPRRVYHNVVIALDRSRDLTNGQPAIMAEGVGAGGAVVASEVHPELGPAAKQNLADRANVMVCPVDGGQFDPGECDAMLINAGVTHPLRLWLDRLRQGGRLLVPVTVSMGPNLGKGVVVKITRQPNGFAAQIVTFVAIYSATSVRDPQLEPVLGKALATGTFMKIKSVRCDQHSPDESCVVHSQEVCLSLADVAPAK